MLIEHPSRDLEAAQARHLHVEEDHVRPEAIDRRESLDAVAGLADHVDAAELPEQEAQLVPSQLFIVDKDRTQVHLTPLPVRGPSVRGFPRVRRCPRRACS